MGSKQIWILGSRDLPIGTQRYLNLYNMESHCVLAGEGGRSRAVIPVPEEIIRADCIKRRGLDARAATSANSVQQSLAFGAAAIFGVSRQPSLYVPPHSRCRFLSPCFNASAPSCLGVRSSNFHSSLTGFLESENFVIEVKWKNGTRKQVIMTFCLVTIERGGDQSVLRVETFEKEGERGKKKVEILSLFYSVWNKDKCTGSDA